MIQLPHDFREFLKLLNANQVEYLLIGGYAVTLHGFPRYTVDLDIWIKKTEENAERLIRVLGIFGFPTSEIAPARLVMGHRIFRMGIPPLRIEVHNEISGVDFDSCHSRSELFELDRIPVPVISRDDLIANKRATGRLKDLVDIENLIQD